jgi:hypothetical protein
MTVRQRVVATSTVVIFSATLLVAQTFRGGILGSVADSTGGALPGCTVTVTNVGTKLTRSVVTDATGNYFLSELPPGEYTVTGALSGFASQTVKGVRVEVAASLRVNLTLATGGMAESVEVRGDAPVIDTTHNAQGGTIQGEQAAELPLSGRDFTHLMSLVPGASADPAGVSDSPGSFGYLSVNGNRGRSNNYLLDGTDMNDGYRNDPAINEGGVFGVPATILPVDAVEEFPVLSGTEPEYGRNSGAIVNIVSKSGTNTFHGAAFEYLRRDSLGARNYFNTVPNTKDPFKNDQFGASLGGPLVKDKTFFFLAFEGQRENGGLPGPVHVPSQADLNAAIAANGGVVNPVIAGILARNPWPQPNQSPDANGNNLVATTPFSNTLESVVAKIDHHFAEQDLLTVRYFFGHSTQNFPLALVGGGGLPGYNTVTPTTVNLVSGSLTHVFTPKLLLEVRGGYNRFFETFSPEDVGFDPNSVGLNTGVTNPRDFGLPQISVSGFATIGSSLGNPRGRTDQNYQAFANLSYNTGRHNMKYGYELRRTTVSQYFDEGFRGQMKFASLEDFVAGRISKGGRSVTGNTDRSTAQNSHGLYVQDSFRASGRFTLNYGARWDYYGVIGEANNKFSIFDTTTGSTRPVTQLYPKRFGNVSPRVSGVYDTKGDGKTVLRVGWGLYYDAFSQDYFIGQVPYNTFNPGVGYNDLQFSFSPAPQIAPGAPVYPASGFSTSLPSLQGFPDVWTVDPNLKTPRIQNYNINLQQQLGRHAVLQIGYVGSQGRNLFRFRDINQATPSAPSPFPNYEFINQFESSASSHYNALQTSLRLLGWRGVTSTMNYTLSKSVDNASDGQDQVPNASQPDDSTHPQNEMGPSNFDSRHRFTWYFTWEIPHQGGGLLSGWSVNGIATYASGMPFNPVFYFTGPNFNGSGEFFGRGDIVGDPYAGTGGPSNFLNLSAFQAPCTPNGSGGCNGGQHFGNQTRNSFYGPSYKNFDLSIVKNTKVGGRATLQLRVDIFNVFNHPNFSNPVLPNFFVDFTQNGLDPATNRGTGFLPLTATPDVGSGNPFLGGGGPRTFQLAARMSF